MKLNYPLRLLQTWLTFRFENQNDAKKGIAKTAFRILPAEILSATQKSCRGSGSDALVRTRTRNSHSKQRMIPFTGFGFAIT
jgi:hypothetical protein